MRHTVNIDERGSFSRIFDAQEFAKAGLCTEFKQFAASGNLRSGTLRGLHYQEEPFSEVKLVRCISGAVFDIVVDLRPTSSTRGEHIAVQLDAADNRVLYIPQGCAHGYMTLHENSQLEYMISAPYRPDSARGVLWSSPALAISWPSDPSVISQRDRNWPEFHA